MNGRRKTDGALSHASRPALTADLLARRFPGAPPPPAPAVAEYDPDRLEAFLGAVLLDARREDDPLWVFAYGSLIWRPELDHGEQRLASIHGWHRRFCLWQYRHRGTPDRPCLMMALDAGGSCRGIAYRIDGPRVRDKLRAVWRREIRAFGYVPRWTCARTAAGAVRTLVFVANRDGDRYAGRLSNAATAGYIANACGHGGPCADYLRLVAENLERLGIRDSMIHRMQSLVADEMRRTIGRADKETGSE